MFGSALQNRIDSIEFGSVRFEIRFWFASFTVYKRIYLLMKLKHYNVHLYGITLAITFYTFLKASLNHLFS